MTVKEIIKLIEKDGWFFVRQTGSHRIFHHPTKRGIAVVPGRDSKDLPKGTQESILKQAGLK